MARPLLTVAPTPTTVRPRSLLLPPRTPPHARGIFVQTQTTPNPASLMFLPGEPVAGAGATATFADPRAARASPLAAAIFRVDGVASVFFGSDFITVTKREEAGWEGIKPGVFEAIMESYASGRPVMPAADASTTPASPPDTAPSPDDSDAVAMIKELIETRIRPAVQEDGGDIDYVSFDEPSGTVTVRMRGACSGCPSSGVTLKSGIENMLAHYIPEVTRVVEADPDEAAVEGERAFQALEKHLSN